ncbi:hypothetical protein [Fluviicola sp.]|jgi:hypothetical protein|uniref:hypothetical protein n=1 Tax=Fluviicola sp. TaxID=1917219 RepID=UPI0028375250|nr:hypothetical protein [Fluviicola sp.]MDR0801939.1 hypothetical protein [Fluviicola sp.]
MSKKKSIISYDKLNIDQKKQLLIAFPEGFSGNTTKMTNPVTGEVFDSLLWETDDIIYLVKLPKMVIKSPSVDDDDDDFDDDFDAVDAKGEDDDMADDDDDDDSYGDAPDDEGEDED